MYKKNVILLQYITFFIGVDKVNGKSVSSSYKISILGVMTGIILIQNFAPFLGYIPIPPLNPTIIHITVIIGAVLYGPFIGAALGFVWGVLCLIRAFIFPTNPIDPIIFINPLVSVLPRVLIGVFAGYFYKWLDKINPKSVLNLIAASILGSFTNTIFVLLFTYLIYREPYAIYFGMNLNEVLPAFLIIISTNGVSEAVAAAVLVPLISKALMIAREN